MKELMIKQELSEGVAAIVEWSEALIIRSESDKSAAFETLKQIKLQIRSVDAFFDPTIKKQHEAHKMSVAGKRTFTDPLKNAERIMKGKLVNYDAEQTIKREAERRRLQAIEDERVRKEKERLEKRAAKLKTPEKVEALLEEAEAISAPSITMVEPEKTEGVSARTIWKANIIDEEKVPREWLMVNQKALDSFAQATKGLSVVPGVNFVSHKSMSVRV